MTPTKTLHHGSQFPARISDDLFFVLYLGFSNFIGYITLNCAAVWMVNWERKCRKTVVACFQAEVQHLFCRTEEDPKTVGWELPLTKREC